ncbi:MAG: CBS domain-containing protein [Enhygromyxa sp.]
MTQQDPPKVSDYMTELPVTVEVGMSLGDALDRMYLDNIRHLPVVDEAGKLVGMLSTRDIAAIAAVRGIEPREARVEEAMARVPFACADHSPLVAVVERMERDRLGSAIVTRDDKPVGIFTTTDALRALRGMLLGKKVEPLVQPEVRLGEGDPSKPVRVPHERATGVKPSDGMVGWFLARL